jgi:hypothetical protein
MLYPFRFQEFGERYNSCVVSGRMRIIRSIILAAIISAAMPPMIARAQIDSLRATEAAPTLHELPQPVSQQPAPVSGPSPVSRGDSATGSSTANTNSPEATQPTLQPQTSTATAAAANTGFGFTDLTPRPVTYPMAFTPYDVNSIGFSFLQSSSGNWLYGEQNFFNVRMTGSSVGDMESGTRILVRDIRRIAPTSNRSA